MGSVNKTPNYGLNQWAGNEYPKRADFNSDNGIVDTQLKANHDATAAHTGNATIHIAQLTCQTSGTAHAITGTLPASGIVSCIFKADANYVAGNTFTVGGTAYTVVTSSGEALRSGAFLANDIVSIKLDITNTKLYIRQDSADQISAIAWRGMLVDQDLNTLFAPGLYYIQSCTNGPAPAGFLEIKNGYSGGVFRREIFIDYYTNNVYIRSCISGVWDTTWGKPNSGKSDYASGLDPSTAPCLVNTLVLPYKTSTIPTGLADNTFVWRLDVAAP